MNILFVYERKINPTFGGVERVTYLLGSELNKIGHNVKFLSVGPEEWNLTSVSTEIEQFYIPFSSENYEIEFKNLIRNKEIKFIIFQGDNPAVVSSLNYVPEGIKKVLVYHNLPFSIYSNEKFCKRITPWSGLRLKGKFLKGMAMISPYLFRKLNLNKYRNLFSEIIKNVDKFIFLSWRYIPRVKKLMPGVEESKLFAINNPNTFITRNIKDVNKKEKIILFVGRLSNPQKNVTGFIDVWKKFSEVHSDWQALIVGDGEHADYIKKYAKKSGVKSLKFEGNRKNIDEYYRRARILCMTSTYEGWPMILTEAMAYGCVPVAYESFEAVNDIIQHKSTGLLVKPFDKQEMLKALCQLAADEKVRSAMAERGRVEINKFSIDVITETWEKLVSSLIQ